MPKLFNIYEWSLFRKFTSSDLLLAKQQLATRNNLLFSDQDDLKDYVSVQEAKDLINILHSNKLLKEKENDLSH